MKGFCDTVVTVRQSRTMLQMCGLYTRAKSRLSHVRKSRLEPPCGYILNAFGILGYAFELWYSERNIFGLEYLAFYSALAFDLGYRGLRAHHTGCSLRKLFYDSVRMLFLSQMQPYPPTSCRKPWYFCRRCTCEIKFNTKIKHSLQDRRTPNTFEGAFWGVFSRPNLNN